MPQENLPLHSKELNDLRGAKSILENPGFAIKIANYVGRPIEFAIEKIDSPILKSATSKALRKSLDIAVSTLGTNKENEPANTKHKWLASTAGAVGGFFGMSALAVELPITTTIMLRSIADIAQSQGHDLSLIETRLACLEVFSLGSTKNHEDDAGKSAYFAARAALSYEMKLALESVANMSNKAIQEALARGNMPILIKLINAIASRFGITVSEKLIAQSLPILGAAGGAAINLIFINHFQEMAEGHFIVKRLEKKYGSETIEKLYHSLEI